MVLKLGKLCGIPVEIEAGWILILGLFTSSISLGYFHRVYPWLPAGMHWLLALLASSAFVIALVSHEFVHSYYASRTRTHADKTTLFLFGGVFGSVEDPDSPGQDLKLSMVGPAFSIAAAGIFRVLMSFFPADSALYVIFTWFVVANALVAGVNLIPAYPLDGGRILRSTMWAATDDLKRSTGFAAQLGRVLGWGMIVSGILAFFAAGYLSGLWLVFTGWFINRSAANSYQGLLMRQALQGVGIESLITHRADAVEPRATLDRLVNDHFLKTYSAVYPVVDQGEVRGIVTLGAVHEVPKDKWPTTPVGSIAKPLDQASIAHPGEEAWQVFGRMDAARISHLVVVNGMDILGIVSREDIIRLLRAREELEVLEMT